MLLAVAVAALDVGALLKALRLMSPHFVHFVVAVVLASVVVVVVFAAKLPFIGN